MSPSPTRAPHPCLDCGQLTHAPRCPTCQALHDRQRNQRRTWYGTHWRRAREAAVGAWIVQHGHTCPGYQRPPHPALDLTGDHRADGTIGVLCRSCNSTKGALEPVFGPRFS